MSTTGPLITILGAPGSTFTYSAYEELAELFGTPHIVTEPETNCRPTAHNPEILSMVAEHGGFGSLAMETDAQGRVAENLESFAKLLTRYDHTLDCPIDVIGCIRMRISFSLMARPGMTFSALKGVITKDKSLDPCRKNLRGLGDIKIELCDNNGLAAEKVATDDEYKEFAALAPRIAAGKYGLKILDGCFEDGPAYTAFNLVGPRSFPKQTGENYRVLLAFRVRQNRHGVMRECLKPFDDHGINLFEVHNIPAGGRDRHDFIYGIEARKDQLEALHKSLEDFRAYDNLQRVLVFGPYPIMIHHR